MAAPVSASLFDAPTGPVLSSASGWVTAMLLGSAAISLCIVAVAIVGLMLMSGRLAIRDGVRVAVGCFVLLGAPVIASGLRSAADEAAPVGVEQVMTRAPAATPPRIPPSDYDPYAGASLRRD